MSLLRKGSCFVGAALCVAFSFEAQAHWCDDLWVSAYNIVVRPESDTVTVPASGSATMTIWVQNNMGYLLPNFVLGAKIGTTTITPSTPAFKTAGTILPGEKVKYTLAISKSGGGTVSIQDITFSVSFGNSGQSHYYPTKNGKAVIVKMAADGALFPAAPQPGIESPQGSGDISQAYVLNYQAIADFDNVDLGLDKLLQLYCAGRKSWDSGSADVVATSCKDTSSTTCSTRTITSSGSKYDYMRLWAAGELAIRKASLGPRLAVFRQRLQCAVDDSNEGFASFAAFMLGYLGADDGAQTFLQSKTSGTGNLATVAKAALYMMGDSSQQSAVKSGATSTGFFGKTACAAALGIVDKDDATVNSVLIPAAKWTEPDTSDNGQGLFASHLLAVVAWDRRGWVAKGAEAGSVTFYGESGASSTGGNGGSGAGGAAGAGGAPGSGGGSGNKDGSVADVKPGTDAVDKGSGGTAGVPGGLGGREPSGGGPGNASGGSSGGGGKGAPDGTGGVASGSGGSSHAGSDATGGAISPTEDTTSGCKCSLGGSSHAPAASVLAIIGLVAVSIRRRRR
jgi:MYXO-CTERM domain-containing protein